MEKFVLKDTDIQVEAQMFGNGKPIDGVKQGCGGWLLRSPNGILRLNLYDWVINLNEYRFILPSLEFNTLFKKVED